MVIFLDTCGCVFDVFVKFEFVLEPVELLENGPVTFDGRMERQHRIAGMEFGGKDFSIVAKIMTGSVGTIVSKARSKGAWMDNCKSLFVDTDGFVTFAVGGVGLINSRTKVNDGQHHEIALVYVAEEGRWVDTA